MTFFDSRIAKPMETPRTTPGNTQDVVPPTERGQDPERNEEELALEGSRPLSDEERKAADRETPVGERVYAPASERVPRTVPGYGDVVERTDTSTPERQATPTPGSEPSFTRVPRPSMPGEFSTEPTDEDYRRDRWMSSFSNGTGLKALGVGWVVLGTCAGIGIWLWLRWQRERNKPINRLRRQARQTASQARDRAYELRDRMPEFEMPDDPRRPAMGVSTALLALALLLWRQSQQRSRLDEARSEARSRSRESIGDWQHRLMDLKDRWAPGRVELEKISIPRR